MVDCANPSLKKLNNCKLVAAIDIGSAYSGYAWSTTNLPKEVEMNKNWGSEFVTQTYKTPTAILVNSDKEFVSFGYKAIRQYTQKKSTHHLYDQNIKMKLYEAKTDNVKVTSRDGKQNMSLQLLMTMSIRFMFLHLMTMLKTAYESFDESVVRVVLTVPAIWTESAKKFMKRAAIQAGINSQNLILALEPEAASLYCRTLRPMELKPEIPGRNVEIPNGTRYMIIDCGGGTVDISVHEVVDDNCVKEIYSANGGPWGGGYINTHFENELHGLFGKEFIDEFKAEHQREWYELILEFEFIKRTFSAIDDHNDNNDDDDDDDDDKNDERSIQLYSSFITAFNAKGTDIADYIKNHEVEGFDYEEGRLVLRRVIIDKICSNISQNILNHIKKLWNNAEIRKIKYAFMVGGFSESEDLFRKVINTMYNLDVNVQVIRPNAAGIAVLKGAVQFGHTPNAITSRMSRMTYGAGVMAAFDRSRHDPSKKIIVDNEEKCIDTFAIWATKNESISVGEKRTFTIFPYSESCTFFEITIYAIDKEEVKYITEPGVHELATLTIPIPSTDVPKYKRPVKHYVYFGGTELHVRIQDETSDNGASTEATISYDQK